MRNSTLLKTGAICTCVTALCCVTPILVIGLGAVGWSAAVGYLEYVLFPALAVFIAVTVYALIMSSRVWIRRRRA